MLARKEGATYARLAEELLQRCGGQGDQAAPLHHVFRFDCSGVGESGGVFTYGGYKQLVNDAGSAVRFLQDKLELEVSEEQAPGRAGRGEGREEKGKRRRGRAWREGTA
jgi:hypothetical protein